MRSGFFYISIHAPPRGGRLFINATVYASTDFNPRPPRGGRLPAGMTIFAVTEFQSTPPARGATFSRLRTTSIDGIFQSTPPARGATTTARSISAKSWHFNPRPPRGGRLIANAVGRCEFHFNPRPPRGGRRFVAVNSNFAHADFNPRPPRGGRQCPCMSCSHLLNISIHAPREGGDSIYTALFPFSFLFQSTPPARGATTLILISPAPEQFQSTPPARGATLAVTVRAWTCTHYFNPRPPRGGRLPWRSCRERKK